MRLDGLVLQNWERSVKRGRWAAVIATGTRGCSTPQDDESGKFMVRSILSHLLQTRDAAPALLASLGAHFPEWRCCSLGWQMGKCNRLS